MNKGRAGNSKANGEIEPTGAKAWVIFKGAAANGPVTILAALNVASVVRTGLGLYTVTFQRPFAQPAFCYQANGKASAGNVLLVHAAATDPGSAGGKQLNCTNVTSTAYDPTEVCFTAWGAQ